MLRHCSLSPSSIKLINNFNKNNESILLVLGHKGNWEWAGNAFALQAKQPLYVIYHPLENKYFNRLFYKMRTRFGIRLIAMKETFKKIKELENEVNVTAFIADQTPQPQGAYWTQFLNQDTPVFLGTEKIATKLNRRIVYTQVNRIKRGYYQVEINEQNILDPKDFKKGDLTKAHTHLLEKDIEASPCTWLWTHRRWKHKR